MSVGAGGRVKSIRDAASGRHPPARWAPLGEAFGPDALVTGSGAPVRGVYRAPLGEAYGTDALVTGPGAPARGVCRAPPGVLI